MSEYNTPKEQFQFITQTVSEDDTVTILFEEDEADSEMTVKDIYTVDSGTNEVVLTSDATSEWAVKVFATKLHSSENEYDIYGITKDAPETRKEIQALSQ